MRCRTFLCMAEWSSRNDASGNVRGHVVQVGTVEGDLTISAAEQARIDHVVGAAEQARIDHARQLREERLVAFQDFLALAIDLAKDLDAAAKKAERLIGIFSDLRPPSDLGKQLSKLAFVDLKERTDSLSARLDELQPVKVSVCLVGPEDASDAARRLCEASVAVWASTVRALNSIDPEFPMSGVSLSLTRWPFKHGRFRESLQDRLHEFMGEARKVREVPPV